MKIRIAVLSAILLLNQGVFSQPSETVKEGILIAEGFRQSIPLSLAGPFDIGFSFTFFGNTYTQFYVSANGLVMFSQPDNLYNVEVTIPDPAKPNNYIAPFWDNLSILDRGNVMYYTIGASPNLKCIIQYKNMGFDPVPTPFGTFSVILYETSNVIQVQYRLIVDPYSLNPHGASATIGLENAEGTAGTLYAFHQGNAVYSEDAISFTPSGSDAYTVNDNAIYEGIFLTTNETLPDPGIVDLVSPPKDAIIGEDHTFMWTAATNASEYYFVLDTNPDLSTATYTNVGLNLSHSVTGLRLEKTYYWSVLASNATGFSWCEVSRFFTDTIPPCMPVPLTRYTEQEQEITIKLLYTNCDNPTAIITSLPSQGDLYQYNAGIRGAPITTVPITVSDPDRNVIYVATGGIGNGVGNFNFRMNDATGDSPEATITINVFEDIPNVLSTAKNINNIEIQFDRKMADPSGKQSQFTVKVNEDTVTIDSASLKTGDPYTILLYLATTLEETDIVSVAYTQGDVASLKGGLLLSFSDQPVTLTAQTITWTQSSTKKYNESPFALTATVSSGLPLTYSSQCPAILTINGNVVTLKGLGKCEITARQDSNTTYARARYIRTFEVLPGDQTINFGSLEEKTYGDPDFNLTATATSGLTVTFSSSNTSVATIDGNNVHITGGGTTTITASQSGNTLWNPADSVERTLIVKQADQTITFDALPVKTYGDADFDPGATASSGLDVTYSSDNENVATIENNMIHITGTGTALITASQSGNTNYKSAEDVSQNLTVEKSSQTITFTSFPDEILMKDNYSLIATASSGLTVLFESQNPAVATVSGNILTAVSKGTVQIRAYNDGNDNYEPAEVFVKVIVTSTHRDIINLFTPNNDGINDYWELPEMDSWGRCDVRIFNRWGKQVFADDNYDNLWDGTSDGDPLPEGPYYYVIKTRNSGTIKGTVNIVR